MSCLVLTTGCADTKRSVTALPTPPERLVCDAAGARPTIPPEYVIDWTKVQTLAQARSEHEKFVAVIRSREGVIVGYLVQVEARLFTCSNNMQWRRDFEAGVVPAE